MIILIIISFILCFIYLYIILLLYKGLKNTKKILLASKSPNNNCFSVIISAHNEENNLARCLESVVWQSIGNQRYEIIVVNDRSTDATEKIAKDFAAKYNNISVINISNTPDGFSPKKYAVSVGIKNAKNEIIVFTDADCIVPFEWLETIDKYFDKNTALVQGITSYEYTPFMNKLFFSLQSIDFISHGIVSASAIGANIPINSNANNFAFRKIAFEEMGGYGDKKLVISGDDDLLLQKIWHSKKWQIKFMADIKAKVKTMPTKNINLVFEQRKRWGSKTIYYNLPQRIMLSSIFIFYLFIFVNLILSIISPLFLFIFFIVFILKFIGELILMIPGLNLFDEKKLKKYIILASLIHLPFIIASVIFGVFGKFRWKEQIFKREINC